MNLNASILTEFYTTLYVLHLAYLQLATLELMGGMCLHLRQLLRIRGLFGLGFHISDVERLFGLEVQQLRYVFLGCVLVLFLFPCNQLST